MTDNDFEEICNKIDQEALRNKDSQSAIYKILEVYRRMSECDRRNADITIIKWLWDENRRFDALVLIDEFLINSLKSQLIELQQQLGAENKPSTIYELKRIKSIINKLM
jgi:hypothetical protein